MAAGVFCNTDILFQIFFELLRVRRSIVGFLVREDNKAWLAAGRLFHIAALDAVDGNTAALACLAEIGGKHRGVAKRIIRRHSRKVYDHV